MPQRVIPPRVAVVVASLTCIVASAHAQPSGGPPKAVVRVAPVEMKPVERRIDATGRLRAVREAQVASREPGRVRAVEVRQGDLVKTGDVLVILDDALLRPEAAAAHAERDRTRALLAEREADLAKAQRDLARLTDLNTRGSASENELFDGRTQADRAVARRDQARAEAEAAEARAMLLDQRLEDLQIRAPFAGQVVARDIDEGEWAERGRTVARIIDLERLEAWIDVPERFVKSLTLTSVELTISIPASSSVVNSPAEAVLSTGDAATRTFPVRATIPNTNGPLRPGMTVTASIPTGESAPQILIPADALLRDDAGWYVFTATGEAPDARTAIPARVEPLFAVEGRTAVRVITGPLYPGAFVITEGNERILFPGQPLSIANSELLAATPPKPQGNN